MAKVKLSHYGTKREKLAPEHLNADIEVLTLETVDEVEVDDPAASSGVRLAMVVSFAEHPDKALWPNRTQIGTLVERLGDETDNWIGAQVVVQRGNVSFKSQSFYKVFVAPTELWDAALKPAKRSKGR